MIEDAVEIADAERAEDQDRRANAGLAQIDALFDVRDREHRRARRLERRRDAARAVAVGVGLDDGDDAGRDHGPAAGAAIEAGFVGEIRADGLEVGFEGGEIDARGRAANHGADYQTPGLEARKLEARLQASLKTRPTTQLSSWC